MRQKRAHYGYYMMSSEVPAVTVGLWNFVEDYVNTHLRHSAARWVFSQARDVSGKLHEQIVRGSGGLYVGCPVRLSVGVG